VGLSAVSNDLQIKADFSGYTAQTGGLVSGDKLVINRASDGAVRTVDASAVVKSTDRYGLPYLAIPSSPDSWSLEARQATNPDLATLGWTITLLDTPWTTQTRAGNIGTALAANQYNSELVNGLLQLQLQAGVAVVIYKAITNANFSYKARVWHTDINANSGTHLGIATSVQRKAGSTVTYYTGVEGSNQLEFKLTAPSTFTSFTTVAMPDNALDSIRYIDFTTSGGGNEQARQVDAENGRLLLNPGSRLFSITPTHCVLWLFTAAGAPVWIDFIRRAPYLSLP
jgi:hypothetical protein